MIAETVDFLSRVKPAPEGSNAPDHDDDIPF
jgi:hypothetical protein